MSSYLRQIVKGAWFYVGLVVMTTGYAFMITPGLGAAPWDIFHLGVSTKLGVSLAPIVQMTGVAIILLNWSLGIRPTVGMILNMLSVGPILQVLLLMVPVPGTVAGRWLMLGVGILMSGLGTALYVSADLGSGPRDGLMIGLTRRLGLSVGVIKNCIDVTVALAGWWLGGPLGIGTICIAVLMGPSVQLGMRLVERIAQYQPLAGFVRPVSLKR